jgi:hypothetical protein
LVGRISVRVLAPAGQAAAIGWRGATRRRLTATDGVAGEVADRTTAMMASWRFPVPKNKNGDPVTAAFQIKLALEE